MVPKGCVLCVSIILKPSEILNKYLIQRRISGTSNNCVEEQKNNYLLRKTKLKSMFDLLHILKIIETRFSTSHG